MTLIGDSDHERLPVADGSPARLTHQPHTVQFFADESRFRDGVGPWFSEGLAAGEPALVIARTDRRHTLSRYLRARGINLERARERGRLVLVDAHELLESLVRGGVPDPARFRESATGLLESSRSRAGRSGKVRVYGEMVDVLWQDGKREVALELEALWNEIRATWSLRLLCGYDMRGFALESDARFFDEVCRLHTHVVPPEPPAAAASESARQRQLASLQQRALALENEVRRRRALEASLRQTLEEQRATEERLREQQRRLEDADRNKDAFLAMLAHELRNPLAPIMAALELARMRLDADQSVARPLDILDRQARHLSRLVDDLLEVSRITSGRIRLSTEVLDAASAVHRAVEISRPLIDSRRHHLSLSLPEQTLWLRADPTRLAQVLGNLLNNAAKYTDPGGDIRLSLGAEGEDVVYRIRDNGIGIPADLLPRLFDLFAQGARSLDRSDGGLGLGLTLARSLVDLHGGRVSAHSDGPGQGSEFVVRLPAVERPPRPGASAERPQKTGRPAPRRIVVVDDNLDAAESLATLLSMTGHDVRVAHDGPSALVAVRTHQPDTVVLDIGLPRMDGYEVARRLRMENGKRLRLIALTGYGRAEDRRRAGEAGFDHHFVKPLDLHVLNAALGHPDDAAGEDERYAEHAGNTDQATGSLD